jgi:hypothetical protein
MSGTGFKNASCKQRALASNLAPGAWRTESGAPVDNEWDRGDLDPASSPRTQEGKWLSSRRHA